MIARPHTAERRHRAPDIAEIGHLGGAPVFLRPDIPDIREDRRHRAIDPDADGPEALLDGFRRRFDRIGIGDIGRQHERSPAHRLDLGRRVVEIVDTAREKSHTCAAPSEGARRRAPNPCRRAGNDNRLCRHRSALIERDQR